MNFFPHILVYEFTQPLRHKQDVTKGQLFSKVQLSEFSFLSWLVAYVLPLLSGLLSLLIFTLFQVLTKMNNKTTSFSHMIYLLHQSLTHTWLSLWILRSQLDQRWKTDNCSHCGFLANWLKHSKLLGSLSHRTEIIQSQPSSQLTLNCWLHLVYIRFKMFLKLSIQYAK